MAKPNPAKQYVDLVADTYSSVPFKFYQLHGKEFHERPLSKEEKSYLKALRVRHPKIKQCYYNSQMALMDDTEGKLKYWEGWACSSTLTIPVHHAWLTLNGKVVDLTLQALRRCSDYKQGTWLYFGIELPKELVMKSMARTRTAMPITEGPFSPEIWGEPANPVTLQNFT